MSEASHRQKNVTNLVKISTNGTSMYVVSLVLGYYSLIGLPSTSRHYGLAFAVASYLEGKLLRYWSVSDRLAVLQLSLGRHSTLTAINAYGPTSQVTLHDQDTQDDFYSALDSVTHQSILFQRPHPNSWGLQQQVRKETYQRTVDRRALMWCQEHKWHSARWSS